ncbi:hypothetical protein M408DRAFT_127217 [Serendipita vermifera MAFF 305830]|uniref:Uncharacterized protein n=1 Tax=Serendipita vermifera MAFF 305830 TaxID=933852 RepID=A0A0C3BA99_SERVB|nr:hypothetical protein M408DRAFT_127217 [Serendipita vermifera MAFF 305830]
MEFYATDSAQAMSNTLWYTVRDAGSCPTSRAPTDLSSATGPVPTGSSWGSSDASMPPLTGATTRMSSSIGSSSIVNTGTATTLHIPTTTGVANPPFASLEPTLDSSGYQISKSAAVAIVGSLLGALLLAIGFCLWRRRRRNMVRSIQRRDQDPAVMDHANLNYSGALLTGPSTIASRASYIDSPDTPSPLPQPHVLPSSKELRMRGGVHRERDLEGGSSVSDASGPLSATDSTSIWPDASDIQQAGPSSQISPRPSGAHQEQSLQARIGRELENILQNPRHRDSPTTLTETSSPLSSLNDVPTSITSEIERPTNMWSEKPPLSLTIPQSHRDTRTVLSSAATPISRRDMEMLADLVAQRLIQDRTPESPTHGHNPAIPPPSYS